MYPSQLDIAHILMKRKKNFDYEEKRSFKRLVSGEAGENVVIEYLKKYGQDHWVVLQNSWLEHFGICECDVVLLTSVGIHLFEVKNYSNSFTYDTGLCYVNGRKIKQNVFSQVEKARSTLKDICNEFSPTIEVSANLVFTGIDCEVAIRTPVNDLNIIARNQLKRNILEIVEEEKQLKFNRKLPLEELVRHIKKYITSNPFLPEPLSPHEIRKLRKGIYCGRCGNFDVLISKKAYIKCSCGYYEPREKAVVRTICEYGVLAYDRGLTKGEVHEFLDKQVSHSYIFKILTKHFTQVKNQKYTYYKNKGLPFHKIKKDFVIKEPRILYLD